MTPARFELDVTAVKGRCPRPLDHGAENSFENHLYAIFINMHFFYNSKSIHIVCEGIAYVTHQPYLQYVSFFTFLHMRFIRNVI